MSKNTILEKYMKDNKLSKAQLAKRCGVSVYLIGRVLEMGNVSTTTLVKIAVATKIRMDDLLGI